MVVNWVCRCLFIFAMTGIVACGNERRPPIGPDLTVPASIVVPRDTIRLLVDDVARIHPVVLNVVGDTLANAPILFASLDTVVATIDASGLVRGRAQGAIEMSVTSGSVSVSVPVRVRVNGTLVVSPGIGLVSSTDTLQLTVVVRDSLGATVPFPPVIYRSPDTSIARVSPTGRVTFGGSTGSVIITANSRGRTDGLLLTAVLARVQNFGPGVTGNASGDVLIWGNRELNRFSPPATVPVAPTVTVPSASSMSDVALSANGTRAYVADGSGGNLIGVDLSGNSELFVQRVGFPLYSPYGPIAVATDPTDSLVYYAANGFIYRLNVVSMDTTRLFEFGTAYHILIRDPWMYVVGSSPVRQYNIRTRTLGREFPNTRFAENIALSEDGATLFVLPQLGVWDVASGDTLPRITINVGAWGSFIAVQPTTGLLWVSAPLSGRVFIVDPVGRALVRTLQPGGAPGQLVFTPSGIGVLGNASSYSEGWVDFVR